MFSYWEQRSFLDYDIIILGAGIVGLSTGISLLESGNPLRILVLERGLLPTGASTKNAGFGCIGSLTELLEDMKNMSVDEVLTLVGHRLEGLEILRNRLGDHTMDYREEGSYELITFDNFQYIEELERVNELMKPITGGQTFILVNELIGKFGFPKNQVAGLIRNCYEGSVDTGKMMKELLKLSQTMGVELKTGAELSNWDFELGKIKIHVRNPMGGEPISFSSRALIICNNGFARDILPKLDLKPGRGQVLVTEPIPGIPFRGIFHFDCGYFYFREIHGRILVGGGRNLDFEGETTSRIELNSIIQTDLESKLRTLVLPGTNARIEFRWAGVMAFGNSRNPIVGVHSPGVYLGVRMGGMGVALGSWIGKELAGLVLSSGFDNA